MIDIFPLSPYNTTFYAGRFVILTFAMLTVRSFRNEDPPRILQLWRNSQQRQDDFSPLLSLSQNQLQSQVLGLPMLDARSISLAFYDDTPVGYIHTTFAPSSDGHSFDYTTGQICFLCVDPQYSDISGVASALIQAGENYLSSLGAKKIFGGSPSPSAPFYTAYYSGGEAVGILHSDETSINAFQKANYTIFQRTVWFCYNLRDFTPAINAETIDYHKKFDIEINEIPMAKTWWEGCAFANGIWFDATAYLAHTNRPIARLRTRVTYPDTENFLTMYGGTWLASLIELRVHPDFADEGIQGYLLGELIRYLVAHNQVVQIETHIAESSPLFVLLRSQSWQKRDSGYVFIKEL